MKDSVEKAQRNAAYAALREGIKHHVIPSPTALVCAVCHHRATLYHHPDGYDEAHWYSVVPLCDTCHLERHKAPFTAPLPLLALAERLRQYRRKEAE